ncbi:MAG: DUF1156 domain-containing protein [Chromatiaceae bacterium]|nr:DUF1156 domain-containing protein [Chromatiaceae bacterium]
MARQPRRTKAEETAELVAAAVGAGRKLHLESVDFADPNRPKTCLEVDFPILPINQIAQIEGNAGKPIYQMSKWWARRRSSVFRAMLIAAATKAPDDPLEAAKTVWDAYYANHQDNAAFRNLKVADIFMGGGTTLVEGARLGMQMFGNDLNPVAWFVVKNELAEVDLAEVEKLFDHIEREVKPQIMPFYACEGPGGERGTWTRVETGEVMDEAFDPLALTPEERKAYSYAGPEVIYTFWAKHGPCSAPGCGHRTPLFSSPVIAIKTLSVRTWAGFQCRGCDSPFDLERHAARMAPDCPLVAADTEAPFAVMDPEGRFVCPHCGFEHRDEIASVKGWSNQLPKDGWKNKKIDLSLLIHPEWMRGDAGADGNGEPLGGSTLSNPDRTGDWLARRQASLRLFEVRGELPDWISDPGSGAAVDTVKGTIPQNAKFTCMAETCGLQQAIVDSIQRTGDTAPIAAFVIHGYSLKRDEAGVPYGGRYFKCVSRDDIDRMDAANLEWTERSVADLAGYWPTAEIPYGHMTHQRQPLPQHGYTHYWNMFNARQLLVHALILRAIDQAFGYSEVTKEVVLGAFQQYLRNQNLFCFWDRGYDKLVPMMSNNNFHPKSNIIENAVFPQLGRGNWTTARETVMEGTSWMRNPWEMVSTSSLVTDHGLSHSILSGKSEKVYTRDPVMRATRVSCGSSSDLGELAALESQDLVITDPPFSGLLHYSELSDFFYVWLRLYLKDKYPGQFGPEFTPKALEAVSNKARQPEDPDGFYKRILTQCWREAHRILKAGGMLAFTFHHKDDEPWVDVLESLFDAGFYLEATYPIRSDETKGKGEFGSKTIEYDIIHVCRKRTQEPTPISWPRLRRQILADVRQLQHLLEHHQREGLPRADIQVIKRGKALEYFSRHYGQVYIEQGREFPVKEALVGINQLLDEEAEGQTQVPVNCEPLTRQFLRIFARQAEVKRDELQKYLRGTGMAPSDFIERGWCLERKKLYYWTSAVEFAQARADKAATLHRDLDQALLLVGAFHPESGVSAKRLLTDDFRPHPALGDLLDWMLRHHPDPAAKSAAISARTRYLSWAAEHRTLVQRQLSLFGLEEDAA